MYKIGCNCLPLIILFITFVFILKFWFLFFLIIFLPIIFISNKKLIENLSKLFKKEKQYESKPGIVYKECPYCNTKAERSEIICKHCGKPFN